VSKLSPDQKRQARRNQRKANKVSAACTVAAVGVAAIPGIGPLIAIAPGAVTALYLLRADAQSDLIMDPPRDDFRRPSHVADSLLHLDVLEESPLGYAAAPLVAALDEASRLLRATVVAVERAAGAELASDSDAAAQRESEAYEWARQAAIQFGRSSSAAVGFAESLTKYEDAQLGPRLPIRLLALASPTALVRLLPPRTVELLRGVGVDLSLARMPRREFLEVSFSYPVRQLIAELGQASEADLAYGDFLRATVDERSLLERRAEIA
jgi:hypothetical protein